MSVPFLPESAPFTPAQRAWLNGFLAGMVTGKQATEAMTAGTKKEDAPAAVSAVVEEEPMPWHDPTIKLEDRLKLAEGSQPARKLMAAMAQLDCGACGYVCQTYAEAIADGAEKDLTRCTPGGKETAKTLKVLIADIAKEGPRAEKVAAAPEIGLPTKATTEVKAFNRNNPFHARLLRSVRLNGPESSKDTRLIELDLKGSHLSYNVGDALGVYPENCPELVVRLMELLDASGAEDVIGRDGAHISLHEALLREYTITQPTDRMLELLARVATDAGEQGELKKMMDDDALCPAGMQVADLLEKHRSARPSAADFVAALSPMSPRLYSISSSFRAHPNKVHLTVGVVKYTNGYDRACKGVASTFLAERIRPGQKVGVFVHPSRNFGLPASGDVPVIMIGPGTGIAPFRAFLQERQATGARGKNWLIFGDQHERCDHLYRDELEGYRGNGLLTRLDTAFSRDQAEKLYVQHRMLEHAAEMWSWLKEGAHFYVCGDASRMASDVDGALKRIIAAQGGLSREETEAHVALMSKSGRYQRDVY